MHACAGDLAQPQLGLSQDVYDSLCAELDTIVHNGALVNHAYSYEQLFEPNVLGSVEVSGTGSCQILSCLATSGTTNHLRNHFARTVVLNFEPCRLCCRRVTKWVHAFGTRGCLHRSVLAMMCRI